MVKEIEGTRSLTFQAQSWMATVTVAQSMMSQPCLWPAKTSHVVVPGSRGGSLKCFCKPVGAEVVDRGSSRDARRSGFFVLFLRCWSPSPCAYSMTLIRRRPTTTTRVNQRYGGISQVVVLGEALFHQNARKSLVSFTTGSLSVCVRCGGCSAWANRKLRNECPSNPTKLGLEVLQRDDWLTLRPDVSWLLEEEAPPSGSVCFSTLGAPLSSV